MFEFFTAVNVIMSVASLYQLAANIVLGGESSLLRQLREQFERTTRRKIVANGSDTHELRPCSCTDTTAITCVRPCITSSWCSLLLSLSSRSAQYSECSVDKLRQKLLSIFRYVRFSHRDIWVRNSSIKVCFVGQATSFISYG